MYMYLVASFDRLISTRPSFPSQTFFFFGKSAGRTKTWSGNETSYKLAAKEFKLYENQIP